MCMLPWRMRWGNCCLAFVHSQTVLPARSGANSRESSFRFSGSVDLLGAAMTNSVANAWSCEGFARLADWPSTVPQTQVRSHICAPRPDPLPQLFLADEVRAEGTVAGRFELHDNRGLECGVGLQLGLRCVVSAALSCLCSRCNRPRTTVVDYTVKTTIGGRFGR
eukprot:SAG11_NODE_2984_length_2791_cov_1.161961_6_plen_164_part_01